MIDHETYSYNVPPMRPNGSIGAHFLLNRLRHDMEQAIICTLYPRSKNGEKGYICELSSQLGCAVGCKFCGCGPLRGNLRPEEVVLQLETLLGEAEKNGISLESANKLSFTDGGEILLNPHCGEIVKATTDIVRASVKVSTTLPDVHLLKKNLAILEDFMRNCEHEVDLQISLFSTNPRIREENSSIRLCSFEEIRTIGERWLDLNPRGRKATITFTLTSKSQVDPREIRDIFPPEIFRMRLHPYKPNSRHMERMSRHDCEVLLDKFREAGYKDPSETYLDDYGEEDEGQFLDLGTNACVNLPSIAA